METFSVESPITVRAGVVKLSPEQAKRRKVMITPIDESEGLYAINTPIMFKAGEEFGSNGSNVPPVEHVKHVESGLSMLEIIMRNKAEAKRVAAEAPVEPVDPVAFKDMSADELKVLVAEAGGEYTNKPDAIAFLESKAAE